MSNFAERLVARSAGAPPAPGISVLAPRPVSRFEPTAAVDIEAIVDAEPLAAAPAATAAASQLRPPLARASIGSRESPRSAGQAPPAAAPPLDGIGKPVEETRAGSLAVRAEAAQAPQPDVGDTLPRRAVPGPVATEIAAARDGSTEVRAAAEAIPPPIVQPRAPVDVEMFPVSLPYPVGEVSPAAASDRAPEAQIVRTDQRAAAPLAQTAMVPEAKAEQPAAPVISIGRIEVQFLPHEPRAPASRPQPERTRGFAAYARARRGEPR